MCKYCLDVFPDTDRSLQRASAVGFTDKYWKVGSTIKIQFLNGSDQQKNFVKEISQEWLEYCNLKFDFGNHAEAQIRIHFAVNGGSYSYIGTDNRNIQFNEHTMQFGWLSQQNPQDKGVVLHEFGHALGLGHEHQNPKGGINWNKENVYNKLSGPPNFWDKDKIDWNVIDRYKKNKTNGTVVDPQSIMMYPIPSEWTQGNFYTTANKKLSEKDKEFISKIYPYGTPITSRNSVIWDNPFPRKIHN